MPAHKDIDEMSLTDILIAMEAIGRRRELYARYKELAVPEVEALIRRLQRGDASAGAELRVIMMPELRRIAHTQTAELRKKNKGRNNWGYAKEVEGDLIVFLFEGGDETNKEDDQSIGLIPLLLAGQYPDIQNPWKWLCQSLNNAAKKYVRGFQRYNRRHISGHEDIYICGVSESDGGLKPDIKRDWIEQLNYQEGWERIGAALSRAEYDVVFAIVEGELTYGAVADHLGITPAQVRRNWENAQKKLIPYLDLESWYAKNAARESRRRAKTPINPICDESDPTVEGEVLWGTSLHFGDAPDKRTFDSTYSTAV